MDKIGLKLKYLGIYQIIGGVIGILNSIRFIPNFGQVNGGVFLIFAAIFLLYVFSICCGYLLLKKRNNIGITLSVYNQFIQVVGFGVLGYAFHFAAGIYGGIKINLTNDTIINFMLGHSMARIDVNNPDGFIEISVNFIALWLLNLFLNLKTELDQVQ